MRAPAGRRPPPSLPRGGGGAGPRVGQLQRLELNAALPRFSQSSPPPGPGEDQGGGLHSKNYGRGLPLPASPGTGEVQVRAWGCYSGSTSASPRHSSPSHYLPRSGGGSRWGVSHTGTEDAAPPSQPPPRRGRCRSESGATTAARTQRCSATVFAVVTSPGTGEDQGGGLHSKNYGRGLPLPASPEAGEVPVREWGDYSGSNSTLLCRGFRRPHLPPVRGRTKVGVFTRRTAAVASPSRPPPGRGAAPRRPAAKRKGR